MPLERTDSYDLILLDSLNDAGHTYAEFKIALRLVNPGGTIVIDDAGIGVDGRIPDCTQPAAVKGVQVYSELQRLGLCSCVHIHQSRKGAQLIIKTVDSRLKSHAWD